MQHLFVDRILSKDVLIREGRRFGEGLKNKIASRSDLTDIEITKIDQLTADIEKDEVFRLVSIRTPFDDFTPIKFDMIFRYEDLDCTESVDLALEHVVHLRNNYLLQLPLGHHCEIYVNINSGRPKLFDLLPIDSYDRIKIGICNKSDWPILRSRLNQSRIEIEERKRNADNYS
jgi:hypothetical protein